MEAVRLVSRRQWGALDARPTEDTPIPRIKVPVEHVVFTHTSGDSCETADQCAEAVRTLQETDMNMRNLPDMRFSFLIGGDGTVYEGRGWNQEPHRPMLHYVYEGKGVEIAYIGNYKYTCPSPIMIRTGFNFLLYGLKKGFILQMFQTLHLN